MRLHFGNQPDVPRVLLFERAQLADVVSQRAHLSGQRIYSSGQRFETLFHIAETLLDAIETVFHLAGAEREAGPQEPRREPSGHVQCTW